MSDDWSHDNKEWQETLDRARLAGWTFEKKSGHTHSVITCPGPVGERHVIPIYSTAKATEDVARRSRKVIRNCEHRQIASELDTVQTLLEDAERLIRAAHALLDREEAGQRMEEILLLAGEQLTAAQDAFDAAADVQEKATAEATSLLGEVEAQAARPESLARTAGSDMRTARLNLKDLPAANDRVAVLTEWLERLREQLDALWLRMSERDA